MASVTTLAITFPGGLWVGSEAQNVSADICAAQLVSQCCSCLPSTASTHSYRDMAVLCATRTHTHTLLSLSLPLSSLPLHVYSTQYTVMGTHRHTRTSYSTSPGRSSPPPPPHSHIVPLSVLPQPFSHARVPLLFSSLQHENNSKYSWPYLCLLFTTIVNLYLTKLYFEGINASFFHI